MSALPASEPDVRGEHHSLLFAVRRSIRYHVRRRRFFDLVHSAANAIGIIFGSAAIVSILSEFRSGYAVGAAAIVTVTSAFDLVIGTQGMARLHDDLAKRFITLERDMVIEGAPTEEAVRRFTARRLEIEADEPPVLRTLDRLCHNELLRAMGYPDTMTVSIPLYHRLLAHVVSVEPPRTA